MSKEDGHLWNKNDLTEMFFLNYSLRSIIEDKTLAISFAKHVSQTCFYYIFVIIVNF